MQLDPFKGAQKLAELAKKEIYDLTHGDDSDLAVDVLGLLTAAAGPLSVSDLAALRSDGQGAPAAADTRHVRRLVEERAARSLERVGPAGKERYQFAHGSLLEYAQTVPDLCDPEFRQRIHHWASWWRGAAGPPRPVGRKARRGISWTPIPPHWPMTRSGWLSWPVTSAGSRQRSRLPVWTGPGRSCGPRPPPRTRRSRRGGDARGGRRPGRNLRPPRPVDQPGFAAAAAVLAGRRVRLKTISPRQIRGRLQCRPGRAWCLVGQPGGPAGRCPVSWAATTGRCRAVAVLRWAGGHRRGRWPGAGVGPGRPATPPAELAGHTGRLRRWRRSAGGGWSPAGRTGGCWCGTRPPQARRRSSWAATADRDDEVTALAALGDGRVVSAGDDGRVLVWDPAAPGPPRPSWAATTARARWRCWPRAGGHRRRRRAGAALGPGQARGPGRAGPPRRRDVRGGGAARTGGWSPAGRPAGAALGPGRPGRRRPSWAATTTRWARWRCWPTGGWYTGGDDGRVLLWDPARPGAARPSWAATTAKWARWRCWPTGGWSPAADDGRVLVWDPARPGTPGRAGPPRRRDVRGGGAGRWAGGRRRVRGAGAGLGPGQARDARPSWAATRTGGRGGGAARWAGGHRRERRAGAGLGPGHARHAPAELGDQSGPVLAVSGDRQVISAGQ